MSQPPPSSLSTRTAPLPTTGSRLASFWSKAAKGWGAAAFAEDDLHQASDQPRAGNTGTTSSSTMF